MMSSIATVWMNRIRAANPLITGVALGIATQAALDEHYSADTAIRAKLNEWNEAPNSQTSRALRYAVLYFQEQLAASSGNGVGQG